ncbi:gephyrin-like [Polyergus mexicanus]|uniref:gephyrin-like n=1 Tax=Polyergus mexicanus TaxID=615972 RepID=UPI0038B57563
MSTEVKKSFTFFIIAVGVENELENYVDIMEKTISDIGGHAIDVHYMRCNLYEIKMYLMSSCDANKADIIGIIGENKLMEENIVSMATKTVISAVIYKQLTPDILELETKMQDVFPEAVCGIRNKTLILNMFGICLMATIFLKTNKEKILRIVQKIAQIEETNNNKSSVFKMLNSSVKKIKMIAKEYRKTLSPIFTVSEAIHMIGSIVSQHYKTTESEYVSVRDAYGKMLFENVYSKCNVPSFRVSAKSGFAIITNDGKNTKKILKAGITSLEVGACIRVNTGAPIPDGATAVIEIKNTKKVNKKVIKEYNDNNSDNKEHFEEEEIEIIIQPKEEENIKAIGCEIKIEEQILNKHTRIGPAEIGMLTCCGIDKVAVVKHQSVGILSIGDELQEPGKTLEPEHIYDSNKLILITLLKREGFDALSFGITNNDIVSIICKMEEILEKVNVIVIIGAAKDKDILKPILRGYFNATIHFGAVFMKPGKSTTYATCIFKSTMKHFLCLSKNPTIVPIAAHLFLLPLLNELRCFHKEWPLVVSRIRLAPNLYSRPKYVWTSLKWNKEDTYPWIHDISNHYNHNANALLRLPPSTVEASKLLPDAFVTTIFVGSR